MNHGVEIALITGDGDPGDTFHDLASSLVILTTPEKWDSLTRRCTERFYLFGSVKLFLVDEYQQRMLLRGCHLSHEGNPTRRTPL